MGEEIGMVFTRNREGATPASVRKRATSAARRSQRYSLKAVEPAARLQRLDPNGGSAPGGEEMFGDPLDRGLLIGLEEERSAEKA